MFWKEDVRFCDNCKHWRTKDWSAWNYECKLGKKTHQGKHTVACNNFEQHAGILSPAYYCKDCARWDEKIFSAKCIKGYSTPKGKDSAACKYFVKG
jgi:hypothetical protein